MIGPVYTMILLYIVKSKTAYKSVGKLSSQILYVDCIPWLYIVMCEGHVVSLHCDSIMPVELPLRVESLWIYGASVLIQKLKYRMDQVIDEVLGHLHCSEKSFLSFDMVMFGSTVRVMSGFPDSYLRMNISIASILFTFAP